MNGLSLFSGAGIGELAFKQIFPDYRTIGYVEWDKYCQEVIRARIRDGILDDGPIFGDIRQFNERYAGLYTGKVDWLSGGFPCQPFSVAGNRAGEADERNMWPATRDTIRIIRPRYVFLENVPGLIAHGYIRRVFGDLAEMRYDCEWDIVGAADVGAPHRRKRLWIMANSTGQRRTETGSDRQRPEKRVAGGGSISNTTKPRLEGQESTGKLSGGQQGLSAERGCLYDVSDTEKTKWWRTDPADDYRWWYSEIGGQDQSDGGAERGDSQPDMGRVAARMASRVDRLKALGNGWVPQVVKAILRVESDKA